MYYIYELQMPQEMAEQFERVAAERGVTTDELFCETLQYYIDHPEELKALKEEYKDQPEVVQIIRKYPVLDGESEEEAKARALLAEDNGRGMFVDDMCVSDLPVITEQELCDHVEDDDFFEKYGNPVLVQSKNSGKVVFMSFELYERQMRQAGKTDELEKVKNAIAGEKNESRIDAYGK